MKTIRSLSMTVALAGLFGVMGASAADASEGTTANCREEIKRVAVWPRTPPKAPQMARFEDRLITICDNKVVSSKPLTKEQLQARESGN
jgi:hypothetical protein